MKIAISIEVEPDEVPLATELLHTLKLLTEHIQGAPAPTVTITSGAGAPPTPRPTTVVPVPQPAPQPAVAPPPPAPSSKEILEQLITDLGRQSGHDAASLSAVAAQIGAIMSAQAVVPDPGDAAAVEAANVAQVQAFLDVFTAIAFHPDKVQRQESVMPYMQLLPYIPDPFKDKVRGKIIQQVLTHFTKKRAVDVDRREFYLQAEAFAVLVVVGMVQIDGALQTITKLMKQADKRAAAVTTLARTIELNPDKLPNVPQAVMGALYTALADVKEPVFHYDLEFINNGLAQAAVPAAPAASTSAAAAHAAASSGGGAAPAVAVPTPTPSPVDPQPPAQPVPVQRGLAVYATFQGNGGMAFSLCVEPTRGHVITGGRATPITVWSYSGQVVHSMDMTGRYVSAMDLHPAHSLLLSSCVGDGEGTAERPRIDLWDASGSWATRGQIMRQFVKLISCVRALPNCDYFVTGETLHVPPTKYQEQVCLYDLNRAGGPDYSSLMPVAFFTEHDNLVTCVAAVPTNNNLFLSGSRDCTIRVWDRRTSHSVGMLGSDYGDGRGLRAHTDMLTCLDATDTVVMSTSIDNSIGAWDLRAMASGAGSPISQGPLTLINLDESAVLKVAAANAPAPNTCAVTTVKGVYLLDYSDLARPVVTAAQQPGGAATMYHDIKWAPGQPLLFASGENARVDLLQLT